MVTTLSEELLRRWVHEVGFDYIVNDSEDYLSITVHELEDYIKRKLFQMANSIEIIKEQIKRIEEFPTDLLTNSQKAELIKQLKETAIVVIEGVLLPQMEECILKALQVKREPESEHILEPSIKGLEKLALYYKSGLGKEEVSKLKKEIIDLTPPARQARQEEPEEPSASLAWSNFDNISRVQGETRYVLSGSTTGHISEETLPFYYTEPSYQERS